MERFKILTRNIWGFLFCFSYSDWGRGYEKKTTNSGVLISLLEWCCLKICLILSGQPEHLLPLCSLIQLQETASVVEILRWSYQKQSLAELAVKDHPTVPLCLTSGFHLQMQVGFEGDPYSLEVHGGEDFSFLWLQWGTSGSIGRSTTSVLPSHPVPSHKMWQLCVSLNCICIKVWLRLWKAKKEILRYF